MHDIDRVRLETEAFESQALEAGAFELNESGEVFGETENMELASELLEVSSEEEMDHFLGDLVAKAGQSLGQFIRSDDGKALVGILKGAARKVLPTLGASAGRYLGGDTGAKLGAQVASAAGRAFGLELEGLSNEDREFEVARRFVDFAGEAARNLATTAAQGEAQMATGQRLTDAVRAAALAAARTHAPGLAQAFGKLRAALPIATPSETASGRWMRQGNKIVLFGA